eukprot:PhM_4_TR18232/c0_g1_i1/m.88978
MDRYSHTSLSLALEGAMEHVREQHGAETFTEEMAARVRHHFRSVFDATLQQLPINCSASAVAPLDRSGEFPVFRIVDKHGTLVLKDVDVTMQREGGVGQDRIHLDYLRVEAAPKNEEDENNGDDLQQQKGGGRRGGNKGGSRPAKRRSRE